MTVQKWYLSIDQFIDRYHFNKHDPLTNFYTWQKIAIGWYPEFLQANWKSIKDLQLFIEIIVEYLSERIFRIQENWRNDYIVYNKIKFLTDHNFTFNFF